MKLLTGHKSSRHIVFIYALNSGLSKRGFMVMFGVSHEKTLTIVMIQNSAPIYNVVMLLDDCQRIKIYTRCNDVSV